jgi:hypothetical protein
VVATNINIQTGLYNIDMLVSFPSNSQNTGRRGRDRMVVDTDVVSSNLDQGEVYSIM